MEGRGAASLSRSFKLDEFETGAQDDSNDYRIFVVMQHYLSKKSSEGYFR